MSVTSGLQFRPATLDDAERVADLWTAREPERPADTLELRHWWASRDPEWTNEDFLIERDGELAGFAAHGHAPWRFRPTRFADLMVIFGSAEETPANLDAGYDAMEGRARRDGAEVFRSRVQEDRADLVAYLTGRGYCEDRRSKRWGLDLTTQREALLRMLEASRARMRDQGIEIHPIDADRDPEVYRKLHALGEETAQDVPTTVPLDHRLVFRIEFPDHLASHHRKRLHRLTRPGISLTCPSDEKDREPRVGEGSHSS